MVFLITVILIGHILDSEHHKGNGNIEEKRGRRHQSETRFRREFPMLCLLKRGLELGMSLLINTTLWSFGPMGLPLSSTTNFS